MPSVWSGHLHFGLVVMPVRLLVAARPKTTRFRRLHRKPGAQPAQEFPLGEPTRASEDRGDVPLTESSTQTFSHQEPSLTERQYEYEPVRQVLQSQSTGEELRPDELVKGYEFAPNQFTSIDPAEIKAADVETSDTIDLFHFVPRADVDPIYFERSYYVVPGSGAEKVYALLLQAMHKQDCLGIARIGMHRREHMLILRPRNDCLIAHTMFYVNEIRPAPHLELGTRFSDKELSMATALITGYSGSFNPEQFQDLYQERIQKIIDVQMSGIQRERQSLSKRPAAKVPDLMESLQLSLAQIESRKSEPKPSKKTAQKAAATAKKKPQKVRA